MAELPPRPHPIALEFRAELTRVIDATLARCQACPEPPLAQASVLGSLLQAAFDGACRTQVPFEVVVQLLAHTYGADEVDVEVEVDGIPAPKGAAS